MYKFFEYLRKRRIVFWGVVFGIVVLLSGLTARCVFEENIFKLLPEPEKGAKTDYRVTFENLKLKDMIFVQAVVKAPADTTDFEMPDASVTAEAMDFFMDSLLVATEGKEMIQYTLYDVEPDALLEVADYAFLHLPGYVDVTPELLDSLTTPEHVRAQLEQYLALLNSSLGASLQDIVGYDPCGIGLGAFSSLLPKDASLAEMTESDGAPSQYMNGHLYAPDFETCLGFITPSFGQEDSRKADRLVATMKNVRDVVRERYPGVDILFHGTIILAGGNSKQMRSDIYLTVGIAMLIVFLLLALCLKRPSYLMITLMALVFGVIMAMAGIYLIQNSISMMSLGIGCIVLGVAFSYVLHVMIHYLYTGSVEDTLKEQTKPVLVGALTTIGAFGGLLLTNSPLLKDFGLFALLVIAGTTLFSLVVAPHVLPRRFKPNRRAFEFLEKMNSYHLDRNKLVVAITVIWVGVCICFSGKYAFDNDLRNIGYFHPDCIEAQDHWKKTMNEGYSTQFYAAYGKTLEEALEKLPAIEKSVDSLRAEGIVMPGLNHSLLMPSLATQEARIQVWRDYFTPAKQKEVWRTVEKECKKLCIEPSLFESFKLQMEEPEPADLIAESEILTDRPEVREFVVEEMKDLYLVYFSVKTTKENTLAVNDCLTELDGCMLMDPYYYCKNLIEIMHDDFNLIMWISSAFVLLLLLVTYRNIWLTLIALLPMVLSWYTVLGAMAIFGQEFNLVNIIVSSFVFGIGVDYSVFIMEGLLKGDDDNPTMVYNKTAITMSAMILVICMFVLGFAIHPAVQSISFASLVGMITTIMLSYTIEPILYRFYLKCKNRKKKN